MEVTYVGWDKAVGHRLAGKQSFEWPDEEVSEQRCRGFKSLDGLKRWEEPEADSGAERWEQGCWAPAAASFSLHSRTRQRSLEASSFYLEFGENSVNKHRIPT